MSTQQQQQSDRPAGQQHGGRQSQRQGRAPAALPVRLVPLGGLGEIGKNMMAIEYGGEIIVVDAGLMFPDDEMLGVDLVIPDASYLLDKLDRIRGVFITHGHEDHIGGLPYVLPQLNYPPVYASPLTHGLITVKLREHRQHELAQLHSVQPEGTVDAGPFQVRFVRVNHSIPDAMALAVTTPAGVIVHTGDYKFDYTPVDERRAELGAFARLGDEGVLVVCGDSTRVESPGYTPSERVIQDTFNRIFAEAKGRIIIATFASLISRAQMVIDEAVRHHRKVALLGRSMINNVQMAIEMGYLHIPAGTQVPIEDIDHVPARELVILCTGSQGEPTSALTRIANGDNRWVSIQPGDTVILSSTPIVGNERAVSRNIDNLMRQGAEVFYQGRAQVHVSGHGSREELKLMLALLRPKYVVPVHGEFRMLAQHKELAISMGVPPENVVVAQDGDIIEASDEGGIAIVGHVPNGNVFVDGLGVGDVGQVVLRDRQVLSADGVLVVVLTIDAETGEPMGAPDIISRGFVYERESEALMDAAKHRVEYVFHEAAKHHRATDWGFLKNKIRDTLGQFFYDRLKRRPMILPIVVEV
ncbi:MAG TPA: ribonuclease J [Ktedonobacterales bacterium]|nr:ribonuclease J [Ktedonobacterales bacterium]